VNPITAVGLLDKCVEYKARAVIQNGAASQLGRMIIKVFREKGIPLINVVRREEQVELLKKEYGAEYVLNSSDESYENDLFELAQKLGANVALECVAGN
jgi:NADPH:quinone reductase-like Zn-dependent oxidoreductase